VPGQCANVLTHRPTPKGAQPWHRLGRSLMRAPNLLENPGLIVVPQSLAIREAADSLILIWAATGSDEWTNRIAYLPI
jgi:hypothetical protein